MDRPRVSAVRVFFRLQGWLFVIPLALALLFGWLQREESENARLLYEYGVDAVATVVAKDRTSQSGSGTTATRGYNYTVRYRFRADGEELVQDQAVNQDFYARVSLDQEVPVRYVRTDPRISEVEPGVAAAAAIWIGVVAAIAALVALAFLLWRGRLVRSALRAARHGELRTARVTAQVPSAIRVRRTRLHRLVWIDSKRVEGRSRAASPRRLAHQPVGSDILVFADPTNGRTWWAGDLGIRAE